MLDNATHPFEEVSVRIHPRLTTLIALISMLAVPPAHASYGDKPEAPPPAARGSDTPQADASSETPRQRADMWYRDAYKDVEKGSSELAAGKADNAKKKYQRALDRSRRAVELDTTYYQAWNLVGFTSRKLGDYPGSFAAYRAALRLKPDYALAREYYGEGLLETGNLAGAKEQLAALVRIGDAAMIAELRAAVSAYEAAHPAGATAPVDSAQAGSGSKPIR